MTTHDTRSLVRRSSWAAAAVLAASTMMIALVGAAPAGAEIRPVPEASGYDYSAGEPAILGGAAGTAGAYYDRGCSGSYAIAGDSGFFLLTACLGSTDGTVRGDAGYYADVAAYRQAEPTQMTKMRPGNDAHQNVIDPITTKVPGDGLIRGWTPTSQQTSGMLVGKMGIGSGWTEGRITGLGYTGLGVYLICTDAPTSLGDAGGPVWRNDQNGLRALGTVVAETETGGMCYRPIQETLYEFGAYLPSFGPDQGRPGYGRFAPGLGLVQPGPLYGLTTVLQKGDEWRPGQ